MLSYMCLYPLMSRRNLLQHVYFEVMKKNLSKTGVRNSYLQTIRLLEKRAVLKIDGKFSHDGVLVQKLEVPTNDCQMIFNFSTR